jgi:DNA polymerase (family 10)
MSLNSELADIFARMAAVMEIKGEVAFKAIAFSKVSRLLRDLHQDIRQAVEDGTLTQIEGIGKSSQKIIEEYVRTGRSVDCDELSQSVPAGLLPLLQIPGLGPKTIGVFWKQRGVHNMEDLIKALDSGTLAGLKGIGDKKLISIKQGIEFLAQSKGRLGIGEALPIGLALLERLRQVKQVQQAEIAGSLRRRKETIGDVDLICSLKDRNSGPAVSEAFTKFPEVQRVLGQGGTKASVVTIEGLQVDLRIVPPENFGAALLYYTGSQGHNVKIRGRAQDMGMTLNEWGLYKLADYEKAERKSGEAPNLKPLASETEAAVYSQLKLMYVEPELREDRGEVEAAETGKLPKLITQADIRGDLHSHTTASDGTASIEEMAAAAKAKGYEYLAITDHSKSQVIANGLTAERLLKHVAAIRKAGEKIKGIKLLAGCEVDILVDGSMDFEDAVLAELDIVVASPHASLKQDTATATARILRAIKNRYVNIIGHPTGRMINRREGLPLDFPKIFKAAAEQGVALEINAGYPRLDLNEVNARGAIDAGCVLSIDTDAHSTDGLDEIDFGISVARRAWVTVKHVINCWSWPDLNKFLNRRRSR